jgi:hypothetical protein
MKWRRGAARDGVAVRRPDYRLAVELERLAYNSALRALDKQESLLDEVRSRTGILLAASALAASFLGDSAFRDPNPLLAAAAIGAFVATIAASMFILVPRGNQFVFSLSGPNVYTGLFEFKDDLPEVYRRLAYDLERFWIANDEKLRPLFRAFRVAASALVVEILALAALVSDTLV